jgi:hypothetical protein
MKKGDKVYLKGKKEVTGEIIDTKINHIWGNNYPEYLVKYDDIELIPKQDWHDLEHLVLLEELPKGNTGYKKPVCECGVDKVMSNGRHSDYCPLYKEYE